MPHQAAESGDTLIYLSECCTPLTGSQDFCLLILTLLAGVKVGHAVKRTRFYVLPAACMVRCSTALRT